MKKQAPTPKHQLSHNQSSSSILSISKTHNSSKTKQKPLCKISINLQSQQYSLSVYSDSTIKKLALKLIIMLYDNLVQQEFNEEFNMIHQQICQILVERIKWTIKEEQKGKINQWKQELNSILKQYQEYKQSFKNTKFKQHQAFNNNKKNRNQQNKKYFLKNYLTTLKQTSDSQISFQLNRQNKSQQIELSKSFNSNNNQHKYSLYEKGQKSIQKRKQAIKQTKQNKSKVQISYCTFQPNISKSQKKFKSKQKTSVFQRLYSDADQYKTRLMFKKNQIENEQEKKLSQFNYVPNINQCSKLIVQLKQRQEQKSDLQNTNGYQDFDSFDIHSPINYQMRKQQSQKQLKSQYSSKLKNYSSKRKIFQNLSNTNFYQNRLNKTIQKLNLIPQNQHPFQPQLSQGTKRITKNYPSLEKRMKIYQMKKLENNRSSPCFFNSKQKQNQCKSKDKTTNRILKNSIKPRNQSNYASKKTLIQNDKQNFNLTKSSTKQSQIKRNGVKNFLARIKTQPLQEVSISFQNTNYTPSHHVLNKNQKDRYKSEIFKLESSFVDDNQSIFEQITPKKLNLQHHGYPKVKEQKNFFKNKENNKLSSFFSKSNNNNRLQNTQVSQNPQAQTHQTDSSLQQIKSKQDIFQKIFYYLTDNKSKVKQVTSSDVLKNKDIPLNVKIIFKPLIKELQSMDTSLDLQEFVWSLQNLYDQLDFQNKAILLTWGLKICKQNNSTNRQNNRNEFNNNKLRHVKTQGSVFQLVQ